MKSYRDNATSRLIRKIHFPKNENGRTLKISEYYAENVFDFKKALGIPESVKKEMQEISLTGKLLLKEHAEMIAHAVSEWALNKGATHFCHWFQPLTGNSAEKHDSFLNFIYKNGEILPLDKLTASQLLCGGPDASSFPSGGARSTFEARGYTVWDMSSPMFITEGINGKVLCIPTAFAAPNGAALDIKTPLLRSISKISDEATRFLNLIGFPEVKHVTVNSGAEQEYFLVDKAYYNLRPDLVMCGRTLFGSLTAKNQQLEDHYFGNVNDRVLAFMQELDYELYRLGIPSKTRHNEVAPGQFEMAPFYSEANLSSDQNQLVMVIIKKIAERHDFKALLHEKPFSKINGSGKHVNWSLSDDQGNNLLELNTDANYSNSNSISEDKSSKRFLALIAIIVEAVNRHAEVLRMSVASAGNDHRLGANEAPPSIISVFLGDTLSDIFKSIANGTTSHSKNGNVNNNHNGNGNRILNLGAKQLTQLLIDNTDRNRTSPFAFTGNRFEFRAVGSSAPIGFPLSILNAAVIDVLVDSNCFIENHLTKGFSVDDAIEALISRWFKNSEKVVFNGDGYSDEWKLEAARRGLPNLINSTEAIEVLSNECKTNFLIKHGIYRADELNTRYNVLMERYHMQLKIEFATLISMVNQHVLPSVINYKLKLSKFITSLDKIYDGDKSYQTDCDNLYVKSMLQKLNNKSQSLFSKTNKLNNLIKELSLSNNHSAHTNNAINNKEITSTLLPLSQEISLLCNDLEELVAAEHWYLPKYYDMLFLS
ncbi:MAG: glutamine synthetase III [Oligoflexia bacterium]|nr:glutamine synthetase III [Oligoflexia bacterium]